MSNTIGLFKCSNYDVPSILGVFQNAIGRIGFDINQIRGKTVLLKPNMLGAYPPQMGVTTHPAFLEAAIILFKDIGCKIWVGDSANGIFPIDDVWEKTGIRAVCKRHGVIQKVFEHEGGVMRDGIFIAKSVLEADFIINLARFKTHGLTVLTIAVKNLYGCVPGFMKTRYHCENLDHLKFARLLVKISEIVRPALNLVDGIMAMDGTGPSAGRLFKMDTIIAGTNHHVVDAACAKLIKLNPMHVDTLEVASELALWNASEPIEIVGESLEARRPEIFNLPVTYTKGMRDWWISRFVIDKIWHSLSIKPTINKKKCQACGMCVAACPVGAIKTHTCHCDPELCEGKAISLPPHIVIKKCVQCYCCHEICPNKAIDLNESWGVKIGRFLGERRIRKLKSEAQNPKLETNSKLE